MPKQFWLRGFVYTSYFKEEDIIWTFETVGVALSRYPFKWIFYSEVLGRFKQWPMCLRRDPLYITKTTWPCATIYVLYFAHTVCFVPTNRTVQFNPSRNPSWLITLHSSKQMCLCWNTGLHQVAWAVAEASGFWGKSFNTTVEPFHGLFLQSERKAWSIDKIRALGGPNATKQSNCCTVLTDPLLLLLSAERPCLRCIVPLTAVMTFNCMTSTW